jgi:hypothetical protein
MHSRPLSIAFVVALLLLRSLGASTAQNLEPESSGTGPKASTGTGFTYQGLLADTDGPVNATCAFQFRLWDDAADGTLVAGPLELNAVAVSDGLFTAPLDFGDTFDGTALWLEVAVQCPGDTGFTTLDPRQALTAAPYALSLRPGATVAGEVAGKVLYVVNTATAGYCHGIYGQSNSADGRGIYGYAAASSGSTIGVYGRSESTDGRAVYGYGPGYGVYGESTNDIGVYGYGPGYGVYGESTDGTGVAGHGGAAFDLTIGVYGISEASAGYGVHGRAYSSTGVNYGVYGRTYSPDGYGVYYQGGLGGTGLQTTIVETRDHGWRHFYNPGSTEPWFEDFGSAQLVEGRSVVDIDIVFAQAVNLEEPYPVFLTPLGDCGLYVAEQTATSFTVRALDGRTCSIAFHYRILARRAGHEGVRLEPALSNSTLPSPPKGSAAHPLAAEEIRSGSKR